MDRTPYTRAFNKDGAPRWTCSSCNAGHLNLLPDTFISKWTRESTIAYAEEGSEPTWVKMVFACVFECSACKEMFCCTGIGEVDEIQYEDHDGYHQDYVAYYYPKYFEPSLALMDLPLKCPDTVLLKLRDSFSLFFAEAGASLNCARASVEALLTDLGVKRFELKKGKRVGLTLHKRLEGLPEKYQHVKDSLMAVKWLGNAGSHNGKAPTREDVLDAYDLLEGVLSEIYDHKDKKLKALARDVNRRKGPVRRRAG